MSTKFKPFEEGDLEQPDWSWDPERRVFGNPCFGQVFHVTFVRDGQPQNDQMLRAEQGSGCFIPLNSEGEIGLVEHASRPQVTDMDNHRKAWPYPDPSTLCEAIGRSSWEIPRGYAKLGEAGAEAAKREAEEEGGTTIVSTISIGQTCGNTAMEPHLMDVVVGLVDTEGIGTLEADPNERLVTGLTFFCEAKINILITDGKIYCGTTLSALRILEAHGGGGALLEKLRRI